jgi:hypothetical protein
MQHEPRRSTRLPLVTRFLPPHRHDWEFWAYLSVGATTRSSGPSWVPGLARAVARSRTRRGPHDPLTLWPAKATRMTTGRWTEPHMSDQEQTSGQHGDAQPVRWRLVAIVTSTASGNLCPLDGCGAFDDLAKSWISDVSVSPDDVAADHAGLLAVAVVVGAVEGEVAQGGELGLDAVEP